MRVTIQPAGELTVHTLTAPVAMFANSTHIIETPNSLVLVDTQFFLPNALDFRAYADELGKPIDPGGITIDGIEFELEEVLDAEAEVQLVIKVPAARAIATGDIVYSGVHLILAGAPQPWTVALDGLKATSDEFPIVLPGHGLPTAPRVYDVNIEWLDTASELMTTASSGEQFKADLVSAFPDLDLDGAIDFVIPFLFPDEDPEE